MHRLIKARDAETRIAFVGRVGIDTSSRSRGKCVAGVGFDMDDGFVRSRVRGAVGKGGPPVRERVLALQAVVAVLAYTVVVKHAFRASAGVPQAGGGTVEALAIATAGACLEEATLATRRLYDVVHANVPGSTAIVVFLAAPFADSRFRNVRVVFESDGAGATVVSSLARIARHANTGRPAVVGDARISRRGGTGVGSRVVVC